MLRNDQLEQVDPLEEKESGAVASRKEALLGPSVLALQKIKGLDTLDTDGYDKKIGCVLLKEEKDRSNCSAGYWSRMPKRQ